MLKFDGSKKLKQFFSLFVVKFGYFEKKVKTQKQKILTLFIKPENSIKC